MVVWRRWIFPILMVVIFGLIAASLVKVAFFPDEQAAAEAPTAAIADPVVAGRARLDRQSARRRGDHRARRAGRR